MDWRERLHAIIEGIDQTDSDHPGGWWETSTGADFGKGKRDELEGFIASERKAAAQEALEMINQCEDGESCVKCAKTKAEILAKFDIEHNGFIHKFFGKEGEIDVVVQNRPRVVIPLPAQPKAGETITLYGMDRKFPDTSKE